MNIENLSPKRRAYSSALREQQAEETRERILEAVARLLRAGELEDLSHGTVAEAAGASVATVYRYFPNRAALFDALDVWLGRELKRPAFPESFEQMLAGTSDMFAYFEEAHDLFSTERVATLLREAGQERRTERDRALAELLAPLTRHLEPRRANAIQALFRVIYGFDCYEVMRDRFGATPQEAGEAVAWAARILGDRLARDQARGKGDGTTHKKKGKKR